MPVMPLAHRLLYPGERSSSDAEELKARGEHPLVASGSCGLLHLLLPALISPSSATTGPATCEVPFRLAGWLSLPLLRLAEGVEGTLFYLSMVGPERMGAAIDAAMAKAGLAEATAEPVDPAVLRLQLLRAATALHSDAAGGCFDVRPSDMYSLGEPPEGEDSYTPLVTRAEEDLDEPPARPAPDEYWGLLTWGALVSSDGSLAGVAFLEGVLWPRFQPEQFVAAFRKRLQPLVLQVVPNSEIALLKGLGPMALAEGVAQGLGALRTAADMRVRLQKL